MTFQERLDKMIEQHDGLENIPWESMYGQHMTLGTMTDKHLDNCIQYHTGFAMMAEVTPMFQHQGADCEFIVFMMKENKQLRLTSVSNAYIV